MNPLYDGSRRRKSSGRAFRNYLASSTNSLDASPKRHRKKLVAYPNLGMDEADGTFITKSDFLNKWNTHPEMITEPYNIDTEENVLHFLSRYEANWQLTFRRR